MIISRILIGLVFLVNIQCAGAFMLDPAAYMHGFGLEMDYLLILPSRYLGIPA